MSFHPSNVVATDLQDAQLEADEQDPTGRSQVLHAPVINKIPVELLLTIFKLAIEDSAFLPFGSDACAETAFNLSSVCRMWRTITLDYPPLWTYLSFRSPTVISLMLERAKEAPSHLHIDFQKWCDFPGLRYALTRALPRARELCIRGRHTTSIPQFLSFLNATTTSTQHFEFSASDTLADPMYAFGSSQLLKSTIMQLRRLVLECVSLESHTSALFPPHCAHLVHLEFRSVHYLHMQHAFAILAAGASTLETVIFDTPILGGNDVAQGSFPPPTPLNLPRLKHLVLTGIFRPFEAGSPVSLLRHIVYPYTTSLVLQIHVSHLAIQSAVLNVAAAHLRSRRAQLGLQSALLSSEDLPRYPGVRLRMWRKRGVPDLFNLDQYARPLLDLRVTRSSDTADWLAVRTLGALANAAGLGDIIKLAVAPLRSEVPWARMLTRAPSLRELALYGPANVENLCVACSPALMIDGSAPPYHPNDVVGLLPALDVLSVNGLSLRYGYFQQRTQSFDVLSACLRGLRSMLGRKLSELVICYCDTLPADMEELAPFIKDNNIIWDGSEHGTESVPTRMEAIPAPMPLPTSFNSDGAFIALHAPQDDGSEDMAEPFEQPLDDLDALQ